MNSNTTNYYTSAHAILDKPVFKGQLISYINKFNLESASVVNKLDRAHFEETDLELLMNEVNSNSNKKAIDRKSAMSGFFAGVSVCRTITQVRR